MKKGLFWLLILTICCSCVGFSALIRGNVPTAFAANPWDAYNYAPSTHTLAPVAIYTTTGSVSNPTNLLAGNATRLNGNSSSVTVDFGKEVGGIVTLSFAGS